MRTNRLVDKRSPKRRRLDFGADVMSRPWPSHETALVTKPSITRFTQQDFEEKRQDILTIPSRPSFNSVPRLMGFAACQTIAPASDVQQFLESRVFSSDYDPNQIQRLSPTDYRVYGRHMVASYLGRLDDVNHLRLNNLVILRDIGSNAQLVIKMNETRLQDDITRTLLRSGCALLREQFVNIERVEEDDILGNEYNGSAVFVETANGNLNEYMQSAMVENYELSVASFPLHIVQICEVIRQQMVCLFDANNNFMCLNVTSDKILFKCNHETERVHLFLGDLRSALSSDGENYVIAIPPPLHRYSFIYENLSIIVQLRSVEEKEAALSWVLGLLFLEIVALGIFIDLRLSFYPNDLLDLDQDQQSSNYPLLEGNFKELYTKAYKAVLEFLYPRKHKQIMRSSLTAAKSGRQPYDDGIDELLTFDPSKRRSIRRPLI